MLSRHFLRTKVLQYVYANQFGDKDISATEREFEYNIMKLNDLGIIQISMLLEALSLAEKMIQEGSCKFLPTDEDWDIHNYLVDNEFVRRVKNNYELCKHIEHCKFNWDIHEDFFRKAFLSFRNIAAYRSQLVEEQDYEHGKSEVLQFFRYLVNDEGLRTAIVERSLLWDDDFDQVAQYNFMKMKALSENDFTESSSWPLMYDSREEKDEADMQFARELLHNTLIGREESDRLIKSHLQGWDFDRVAPMDVILINMAIAEITSCPSIPERVTVDECIELSKEFSTDRSKLFINGILDRIIIELRAAGRVNKMGRGLVDMSLNEDGEE